MKTSFVFLMTAIACIGSAGAQEEAPTKDSAAAEDPTHGELRALRDRIVEAFKERDFQRLVGYMHPDVVITWQNAEVSRKREGAFEYYERMLLADDPLVKELTVDLQVDETAILHGGDTAIAWGTLGDRYKLRDGMEFAMNSRWSATMVKENGQWLVAAAHGSVNAFDNEIMRTALGKVVFWAGAGGLALGIVLGIVAAVFMKLRGARGSRAPSQ